MNDDNKTLSNTSAIITNHHFKENTNKNKKSFLKYTIKKPQPSPRLWNESCLSSFTLGKKITPPHELQKKMTLMTEIGVFNSCATPSNDYKSITKSTKSVSKILSLNFCDLTVFKNILPNTSCHFNYIDLFKPNIFCE